MFTFLVLQAIFMYTKECTQATRKWNVNIVKIHLLIQINSKSTLGKNTLGRDPIFVRHVVKHSLAAVPYLDIRGMFMIK